MLKMKKILVLGIAAILTLGIAACGKTSSTSNSGSTGGNSTPSESVKPSESTSQTIHTHEYGGWTVTKPATLKADGEQEHTCACGENEKEIIPQLKYQRVDASGNPQDNGDYVLFGFYPQTIKSADVEITSTPVNEAGYYTGNDNELYAKVENASPYRASYKFSDETAIERNNEYFFKVEPIKWKIATTANGTAMLVSESILDSKAYQSQYIENGENCYINSTSVPENTSANNYEYSEIRAWLKGDFYNLFSEKQQEIIKETTVVNDLASTGDKSNPNVSDTPTIDKVFLLSRSEVFSSSFGSKQKMGTDYAKAKGLEVNDKQFSHWYLRSPHEVQKFQRIVDYNGYVNSGSLVYTTNYGIVPALTITL